MAGRQRENSSFQFHPEECSVERGRNSSLETGNWKLETRCKRSGAMNTPHNPVCLVVGAGPGIGRAVALAFAREGFDLALAARRQDKLEAYCQEIRRLGRQAQAYAADAADESSLRTLFERTRAELGDPEVLVFNAACARKGRPTEVGAATWVDDFRCNVVGALVCAQLAAPAMRARGRGSILITGGGFAHEPSAAHASLSADKAALRSLTYALAQELGRDGIHVATVTVYGLLQVGTHFDPERIAEAYLRLHRQVPGCFDTEVTYK
jgi:NAD(P)-dependent dehydrogenase (short-subunit alcohol dehydrogenase family)